MCQVTENNLDNNGTGSSKKRALDLLSPQSGENTNTVITGSSAKQKKKRTTWNYSELRALRKGVAIHGRQCNKWARIKADPNLAIALSNRSNVDLKDKWRSVCSAE